MRMVMTPSHCKDPSAGGCVYSRHAQVGGVVCAARHAWVGKDLILEDLTRGTGGFMAPIY